MVSYKVAFVFFVIPAQAGIQLFQYVLDAGFHRHDDFSTFHGYNNCTCPFFHTPVIPAEAGIQYFFQT